MRIVIRAITLALASYILVADAHSRTSHDGNCGRGVSCYGSMFGGCCSASGKCGSTPDYCGAGCQIKYGYCQDTWGKESPDGTCGGSDGFVCKGSGFGDCCSQYDYCGSADAYCGEGCQPEFGSCSWNSSNSEAMQSSRAKCSPATSPTLPQDSNVKKTSTKHVDRRANDTQTDPSTSTPSCPEINNTIFTTSCGAEFEVQCALDHEGGDISYSGNGFYVETVQDCLAACADYPGCISVAWILGSPKGACYLKDHIGTEISNDSVYGGVLIKNCTSAFTATPSPTSNISITAITAVTTTPASTLSNLTSTPASASDCYVASETPQCVPCEGQGGSLPYCGADVTTDNYKFTPKTCRTVKYNFDITNTTISPNGNQRVALLVNGQMPGPLIEANWGDTVEVTVNNKLQINGTSIHFHGIRQLNNSEYDGVPSITQCPIAPGESMTYRFVAANYGTSWYHSHYAIQAWAGVMGPMIIHGPTSKGYDVDAGTITLQDWSQQTVDSMYDEAQDAINGGPRRMDNGLINGKNTWGIQGAANQTGERFELGSKFEPGKTYLLRVINAAMQSTYKFSIDNHVLEVINMDFTAIQPYTTNILNINIGQRYMVLVKADQTPGNYWMRADNQNACAATTQATDIKGIIRYSNSANTSTTSYPTTTGYSYTGECVDEPLASLIPMAQINPTNADADYTKDVTNENNGENMFKWYLSGTTFNSNYADPTLVRILDNGTEPGYSGDLNLDLPNLGEWIYIIIQSDVPLPHPIHLHGHDFFILAAGSGTYAPGSTPLNLNNPPRRDTANMPAAGFLVIAFETDNPGTWLLHCHIGWHTSMGFALQIIEGKSLIGSTVKDKCGLEGTCATWKKWVESTGFNQYDSGV